MDSRLADQSATVNDPAPPSQGGKLRVVVIGAGFGGLAVVRGLGGQNIDITLVDRQNHHLFQPLLYQVATAALSPADIAAPIRTIVKDHENVHVLLEEVVGVATATKTVLLKSGADLPYDILVLATGARHSYFGNDQWAVHAPGIKTIDDATRVRRTILMAMERAETYRQEKTARRDEYLTFVVIGGGPTGVEMAGAIAELTRHAAAMDFHYITPKCVRIILVEASDRLLLAFPEDLSKAAKQSLEKLGVDVQLNGRVTNIDATGVAVGDQHIDAATVIWAAGVQASGAAAWVDSPRDRAGRVLVEPNLTVPGYDDIYAIGDTVFLANEKGRPIPGIAPAAKQQGEFVAKRIKALVEGRAPPPRFRYRDFGALATIGRQRAVIDFGWLHLSGGLAWLIWSTAHIYFLVGFRNRLLVGLSWLWNYLTFERGARLITGIGDDAAPND